MTIEEYKCIPFKSDGEGHDILIGDEWDSLNRKQRRFIQTQLKKGIIPNFVDVWENTY